MPPLTLQEAARQLKDNGIKLVTREEFLWMVQRGREHNADPTLGRGEFPEGAIFSEDMIGAVIGHGCYGMAVLGMSAEDELLALKVMTDPRAANQLDDLVHEACIQHLDTHGDIFPAVRWVCLGPPAMGMNFATGLSLQKAGRVRHDGKLWLSGPVLWCSSPAMLACLRHMCTKHIVHRDLKPDNILVQKGPANGSGTFFFRVWLGDAGTAQLWDQPPRELEGQKGAEPHLGNMFAQVPETWLFKRLMPGSDLPSMGVVMTGLWLNNQAGLSIWKPHPHQLSALLFTLLAAGGVPFTQGAIARGFKPTSVVHMVMLFLGVLCFAVMMALAPEHRGTAAIHHRLQSAMAEVLLATTRDVPEIAVQRAALQALCLLADAEIAPLVPPHVRPACVHWYGRLFEQLERGVSMLQAGDATLVLDKVEPIKLQISTISLPAHLPVREFMAAVLSAPYPAADPIYSTYTRPGWHSSGLLVVDEPLAVLAYLGNPKSSRAPAVLMQKSLETADWVLQQGLELTQRPLLQYRSSLPGASESLQQEAQEAQQADCRERVPYTTLEPQTLGRMLEEVGGWMATVFTGQAFHNQPVVGGPPAAAAACFALDSLLPALRTTAGLGGDEKLGIEVRLASARAVSELSIGIVYVVQQQLEAAPPDSRDYGWLMTMVAWIICIKVLEMQSEDLLRCACQPAELPLRLQRVDGMVAQERQAVQAAVSSWLAPGSACPPQDQLLVQLAGLARYVAEFQQQCATMQQYVTADPLAALDDLPAAGAAAGFPEAAAGAAAGFPEAAYGAAAAAPPAADAGAAPAAPAMPEPLAYPAAPQPQPVAYPPQPPAWPAAPLPQPQQAVPGCADGGPPAAAPAADEAAAAVLPAGLPGPTAEVAVQPPEPAPAAADPAPATAPPVCHAAPQPSPCPATPGEATTTATEVAAGRQQERSAPEAAAGDQQPAASMAAGAHSQQGSQQAVPGRVLAPRQPQPSRPASRGQAAPAAAAAAGKTRFRRVGEMLRFLRNLPEHSRPSQLIGSLEERAPDECASTALSKIEEEAPLLSARRMLPQADQALLQQPGSGAGDEQGGSGIVNALGLDFHRILRLGKRMPAHAAKVEAAPPLPTERRVTGIRRSAPPGLSPALPKSRCVKTSQEVAASAIPTAAAPAAVPSALPSRRKLDQIDLAANGPIVKTDQLLVRLVERRSSECPLVEGVLLMEQSELRIGLKQFQLDMYHGHKAVRQAISSLMLGSGPELQRFAASQGIGAAELPRLPERFGGLLEIDLACLAPTAPTAALEAMPTALTSCAAGWGGQAQETDAAAAAATPGRGPRLDFCSASQLAGKTDAEIQAARAALLHWAATNSGRLAVVHEGGGVNVRFRLNRQHPEACAASGSWHTVAIMLPAKKKQT